MLLPYREDPRSATFGARYDCLLDRLGLCLLVSDVLLVGADDEEVMMLVCSLDRFSAEYQGMIGSCFGFWVYVICCLVWVADLTGSSDFF
jgi:hypothetical protein